MGMTGAGDFELGTHHQGVGKLPLCTHAMRWNRTAVGRDEIHQTKPKRLHTRMRSDLKRTVHGCRRFNQHMQRQVMGASLNQGLLGQQHIGQRLHFGHHDMHQARTRSACNGRHIGLETGMVYGVHAHGHAGIGGGIQGQLGDQRGMFDLAAHGRTVFTIQTHIKHAGAKLLRHLGLQLQAFAHPHFDTAVMVTDGQLKARSLGTQQHIARMEQRRPHARNGV